MGVAIRPDRAQRALTAEEAAERWDQYVKSGVTPDEATKRVLAEGAPPPAKDLSAPEHNLTEGTDPSSGRGGMLRSALQGLSMGFSDEALATFRNMGGPVTKTRGAPEESATAFGDLTRTPEYGAAVGDERARLAEYREAHPVKAIGATVAGGLATAPLFATEAAGAAGMRALMGAGARAGAVGGAVAGVGSGEGGIVQRVPSAGEGGFLGAAFGATLPPLVRGLQLAGQRFLPAPAAPSGPQGVTLHSNPLGAAAMAARRAMFGTVDENTDEMLLRSVERDVPEGLPEVQRRAAEDAAKGAKPMTIMEHAGPNVRGLARGATAVPSAAKQRIPAELAARAEGAESRVMDDLLSAAGGARRNVLSDLEEMAARRSADAEAMYGAIRETPVESEAVVRLLRNPRVQAAYRRARDMSRNAADAAGEGEALPDLDELLGEAGQLKVPLTLGVVDQVKRGLDDMLDGLRRGVGAPDDAGGLGRASLASIAKLRDALVDAADAAVPDYKAARSAFAGHTAMIEAMEQGQKLFTMPVPKAEALLARMGESEREAFRKGAVEALAGRIEDIRPGLDINRRVADRTTDVKRLRLLFEDDASFDQFRDALAREAKMHATRQFVTGNSQTVNKFAELAEIAGVDVGDLMQGLANPGRLAAMLAKSAVAQRMRGVTTATADALAPKLLAGSRGGVAAPEDLMALLENLSKASARVAERRAGAARAGAAAGTFAPRLNQPNR